MKPYTTEKSSVITCMWDRTSPASIRFVVIKVVVNGSSVCRVLVDARPGQQRVRWSTFAKPMQVMLASFRNIICLRCSLHYFSLRKSTVDFIHFLVLKTSTVSCAGMQPYLTSRLVRLLSHVRQCVFEDLDKAYTLLQKTTTVTFFRSDGCLLCFR